MGDGDYGAVLGRILKGGKDCLLGGGVQVCGDFVQEQNGGLGGNGTGNGKKLPLSLGEYGWSTGGIVAFSR